METVEKRVTTKRAAEIVGIGYEGLRGYVKRGLLASDRRAAPKRRKPITSGWLHKKFSLHELCGYRLAKSLMEAGVSFEKANAIASEESLRQYFVADEDDTHLLLGADRFLVVFSEAGDHLVYASPQQLTDSLPVDSANDQGAMILLNLGAIRRRVIEKLRAE